MWLARYFRPNKINILKKEIESLSKITLKVVSQYFINKKRLKKQQKVYNKQGTTIFIIVSNKYKVKQLSAKGFWFRKRVKMVQNFRNQDQDLYI